MPGLKPPEEEDGNASVSRADTVRAPNVASSRHKHRDIPEAVGGGRFILEKKLGEGSFGMVFSAHDTKLNQKVAVKLESKKSSAAGQLANESRLMEVFAKPTVQLGFAELFYFGKETSYTIMAMDMLSMSMEDAMQKVGGKMTPGTCANAAEQGIHLLAYLHSKGIVHRDIKSENFMWGMVGSKMNHLYIIDFGMSTRYFLKKHISPQSGKQLTGTARYASINSMRGLNQSRRDDLEALGHVIVYGLRGSLPWSGLDAPSYKEKLRLICETKASLPLPTLCKGFPPEFESFLSYGRNLNFEKRPDYDGLVASFRKFRATSSPPVEDHELDWLRGKEFEPKDLVPLRTLEPCAAQPDDEDLLSG